MPALDTQRVAVLLDMAGCPNRCRHCWLGAAPNRRLPVDALRQVAAEFRAWRRPGATEPHFPMVDIASWYREPDFAPDYRELHQLEQQLSDGNVSRFELLSIWRLARDDSYATWAREVGTEACQITFFGLEDTTDWFTRRPGSFGDSLLATERLIEAGIRPRWQIILTKRFLPEAEAFVNLVRSLRLEERTGTMGGEFAIFLNTPSPDGEAWHIEDLRPTRDDLSRFPDYLVAKTVKHRGAETLEACLGRPEGELLPEMLGCTEPAAALPGVLPQWPAFRVDSGFDVYTNLGETAPWWRLGNLGEDGLDAIMHRYETDATPGLQALFHVPVAELARRHGRREGRGLYSPSDLIIRWIRMESSG